MTSVRRIDQGQGKAIGPPVGPLMKIPEVAQRLNVGRTTVYELVRRGEITPIRIGRAVRFEPSAVDELIEGLAAQAKAARVLPPRLRRLR